MLRQLPRLCRSLSTTDAHLPSTPASIVTAPAPPTPALLDSPRSGQPVHAAPSTPSTQSTLSTQPMHSSQPTKSHNFVKLAQSAQSAQSTPPTAADAIPQTTSYDQPPFRTHKFFTALERNFPPSTARSLMRATRSLLVDRMNNVKRTSLTTQDLENVHPLLILCWILY
jgi:hypothetical protein